MTDDNTPPHPNTSSTPLTLPDDLTVQSLSRLTAHALPDHPAAQLAVLNDRFLALMHVEGDQTRLLMRQAQTLDALFHYFIKHGIGDDAGDLSTLLMALKSQSLTTDAIKSVHLIDYWQTLTQSLREKPAGLSPAPPSHPHASTAHAATPVEESDFLQYVNRNAPTPEISTNELKDNENGS